MDRGNAEEKEIWRREADLEPIGALFHKGGGRWTQLFGVLDTSTFTGTPEIIGQDRLAVIERCATVVGSEVSAGRLDDGALLSYAPASREAEALRPAARGLLELLEVLMRVEPKGPQSWIAELLQDVESRASCEEDLAAIFAGPGRTLMEVLRQRFAPGRTPSTPTPSNQRVAQSAAHFAQAEAVKVARVALETKPLVRLRTAMALARVLRQEWGPLDDQLHIAHLYGQLTKRGLVKRFETAEAVFLLDQVDRERPTNPLEEVAAQLKANLADQIDMERMVQNTGISAQRLRSMFQEFYGMYPLEWLQRTRVQAAQDYLANTRMSVKEIGRKCGLLSYSSFNRAFKKHTGMLPGDYRRTHHYTGNPRVATALRWAESRLTTPIKYKDMASEAGYSLTVFSSELKKETGQTPAKWLNDKRIRLAREMLKNGDRPISEIVGMSGFGSRSTFVSRFKEHTGLTPSQYRADRRAQPQPQLRLRPDPSWTPIGRN